MTRPAIVAWVRNVSARTWWFVGVSVVLVVVDQITKWLAVAHLTRAFESGSGTAPLSFWQKMSRFLWHEHPVATEPIAVIENFWHFKYVENPGAAWGFLAGASSEWRTPFFLVVSIAAMIFIIAYFRKTGAEQRLLQCALALVFSGAVGNFIDRVRLGYVIDFIDWHWYEQARWPTFNVADAAISVGVGMMVLDMMLHKPEKPSKQTEH